MAAFCKTLRIVTFLVAASLFLAQLAFSQATVPLLRLQRSKAFLDIDSHVEHGQGLSGVTTGNAGDIWRYPNALSCLVVFDDGKYVIEKRDEPNLGKPKIKAAEGTLPAADLQQLKTILDNEALQKLVSPPVPDLPSDTVAMREVESIDTQIKRTGTVQHFTTLKRRVKTSAASGMDTFLDNGTQSRKTIEPLMKWFDALDKKSKNDFKDAQPQYCAPLNID